MLLKMWHTTITRIRPGTKEERGSTVPDWEHADRLDIGECLMQPASTSLSQDGRILGVTDGMTACTPLEADILIWGTSTPSTGIPCDGWASEDWSTCS